MTTTQAKIQLTCLHVHVIDGPVLMGDKFDCPKGRCAGRPRKIIKISDVTPDPEIEAERAAAEAAGPTPSPTDYRTPNPFPEPTPEAPAEEYDTFKAQKEWRTLKAWRTAGSKGDRPSTENLDAMNAAHAGGARPAPKTNGGTRKPRNADPVRAEANKARKDKGAGGRPNLRRVSDEELAAYVTAARAAHPETRSVDLRDYALWVDEISVSFARWDRTWAATTPAP